MDKMDVNRIWELVIGKLHNNLNEEEERQFSEIENSEDTRKAFKQAGNIYTKSRNSFIARQIDKEKNWKYINNQIRYLIPVRKLVTPFTRYAAVFVVALLIGVMIRDSFREGSQTSAYNSIEIEWGQMGKMTLSDGTKVWLNAGTIFEYPTTFNTKKRSVILNGEAQFRVVHNKKIPFEVITKTGIIKVFGTTFNVESYDDAQEMIVTLIEGKVVVENNKGSHLATLNPSEQISINKQSGESRLKTVDTRFYNSWIDGKIWLEETKLADLVTILERWYNVKINITGADVGDIKVSGTIIKGKPLDLFLKILERMYGVRYELTMNDNKKDEITIYKN